MGGGSSSRRRAALSDEEVAQVVRRAAEGDGAAWAQLIELHVALLWAVALRHGVGEAEAADVVQTTWVRLFEHIDDIRDPARISAWLATTAQREALRVVAMRRRVLLRPDFEGLDGPDRLAAPVDEALLTRELSARARAAVSALPAAWSELLEQLVKDPPPTYDEISRLLEMPIGSIGPTRGRSLGLVRAALAAD